MDGDEIPVRGSGSDTLGPAAFAVGLDHLSALLTHVDAVVLTFDATGIVTFVSNGVREMFGYEPQDIIGHRTFEFVHPDDAVRLLTELRRWIGREGATRVDNVRFRTSWGEYREIGFETVTGDSVVPFGAAVATLRPVRDSTSIEQELHQRQVNDDRLTRLVRAFTAGETDFDECINGAISALGAIEGVDSVSVWRMQDGLLHHRFQWAAPSVSPTLGEFEPFRPESMDFGRTLLRLEEASLRSVGDNGNGVRSAAAEMARRGARCFLAIPMITDGQLAGFVSFASSHDDNIFAPANRSTLRAATGILAEAFARHEVQARLEHQARHDSLTGLGNRWAFGAAVEEALRGLAAKESRGVAVLLFDLDRFNVINDSLGHPMGDGLLIAVADRLQRLVRANELLARLGGDELVVLVPDVASHEDAEHRAETLLSAFAEPFLVAGSELRIGASVGVSLVQDSSGDRSQLLREADAAMYVAKRRGGQRAQAYDVKLRDELSLRLGRERDLHGAVDRDEFILHYQPEFDLQTGDVVGAEALVRWEHPHSGLLGPIEFIGVAEDSGLIVDIGYWVIERALRQLRAWLAEDATPGFLMRINLSARQIAHNGLVPRVTDLVYASGVDASQVCFELTETAVMIDPQGALQVLEGLKGIGVSIAIDDFGTGYSSLAYLHQFPIDVLKIDRSFVSRLDADESDESLVRAIILMADALGLPVTAEGIETVDQLEKLVELGCAHGQGYLLARPAPALDLADLITRGVTPRP